MSRGTIAWINLQALAHNLHVIRKKVPHAKILAMVKCNAYGHGAVECAKTLKEADALGVACLKEALELREAGIEQPLVLMAGLMDEDELPAFLHYRLQAVLHHPTQLEWLSRAKLTQPLTVWIKVDSGMHRLGFPLSRLPDVMQSLQKMPSVHVAGWINHLACADNRDDTLTQEQCIRFREAVVHWPGARSVGNSAAIFNYPELIQHDEWIRPGLSLYGISPIKDRIGLELELQPVMTLQAKLIAIREVEPGERVGYGGEPVGNHPTLIGTLSIGYGDGYPRHLPSGSPVFIRGQRVPLIGRVSMDMIGVDLNTVPQARVGDVAILWGAPLPIETIAENAHTIPNELICHIHPRVERRFVMESFVI